MSSRKRSAAEMQKTAAAFGKCKRHVAESIRRWLETRLARLPGRPNMVEAIRYAIRRWDRLGAFVSDGRVEAAETSAFPA